MSINPSEPTEQGTPLRNDDTAAFKRFYFQETPKVPKSWLYRLFVGWWRDRA